ncbi:cysteine-rich with EGF-like domain protein 2 [Leptidea sinapis]|uniref:cysteine-rich with EGF-like domain protein 2 n=1 Tax=Leptidea sinapis TaxID=189913 RepID=UPI0021C492F2|nr:cysteine-rich with EGF-like domain protein 2 [Leptidea sinapis]
MFTINKVVLITYYLIFVLSSYNLQAQKNHSKKLSECRRCKIYSDSFNNWFEKTSRGKFEGGDAAWEEAKLKSYSRSEVRLVEIQENLCSELNHYKDECYSLAEEVEAFVEKWWLGNNALDLYSWLCIETIKYCCPKNHFGPSCTPCPRDTNNSICNNHGTCNGDGTRKGNGDCKCYTGYSGQFCSMCARNYFLFESVCKPCHKSCDKCYGEGNKNCIDCALGWKLEDGMCTDINECSLNNIVCSSDQFCINNEGSFYCKPCDRTCDKCSGYGPHACTECKPGHQLWSGKCLNNILATQHTINAYYRLFLYIPIILILLYFYQRAKSLVALMTVIIAIIMYKIEYISEISIQNVILHKYYSLYKENYHV